MIRVLRVVPNMQCGGMENHIMNIYRNINREKIQFDFLTHYSDEFFFDSEIESLGGKVYRLTFRDDGNLFKYIYDLNKFFHDHNEYKIVHAHMASLALFYLTIAKINGAEILLTHSHNSAMDKTISGFIRGMMIRPVKYLSPYRYACSQVAGKFLFNKKSFTLINNATNIEKFTFDSVIRNKIRNSLSLNNKFVIGHVGRFTLQKNHVFLIDVFKNIYEKNNKAILLLVGDGEIEAFVRQYVKNKDLNDSVVFLGVRSDVNELYQAMDVVLFPSLSEGMPNTIIEAQAAGLQSILSDSITKDVKITELVQFISLEESASYWADEVLKYSNGYTRKNTGIELKDAGYDIKTEARKWETFYLDTCGTSCL